MSDTMYSSCPSHPAQGACRGCALEDADRLIRKRLEAFKTDDLATRVAAEIFAGMLKDNVDIDGDDPFEDSKWVTTAAAVAVRYGRIFAEAVAKEGK